MEGEDAMRRLLLTLLVLCVATAAAAQGIITPRPYPFGYPNATIGTGSTGTMALKIVTVTCTIAADTNCTGKGTGTVAVTNAIPAGSLVLGVDVRVTTILAGSDGLATFALGHAGDTDAWGAGFAKAAGTVSGIADFTITTPGYFTSATSVTVSGTAGKLIDSGVVKVSVYYVQFTPIAS